MDDKQQPIESQAPQQPFEPQPTQSPQIPATPQPQPPTLPIPPTPASPSNMKLMYAVIALISVIAAGGVLWWLGRGDDAQAPSPTASATTTPTATPPDPTADWKTYTNDEYGVSVKYPAFKYDLETPGGTISVSANARILDDAEPEDGPSAFWTRIAQSVWHKRYEERETYKIGDSCPTNEEISCEVYSTNPLALKILTTNVESNPTPYMLVFPTEKFQLTIDDLSHDIIDNKLDQILSTFKFTQ